MEGDDRLRSGRDRRGAAGENSVRGRVFNSASRSRPGTSMEEMEVLREPARRPAWCVASSAESGWGSPAFSASDLRRVSELDARATGGRQTTSAPPAAPGPIAGANQRRKSTLPRSHDLVQLIMQAGMFFPANPFSADVRVRCSGCKASHLPCPTNGRARRSLIRWCRR